MKAIKVLRAAMDTRRRGVATRHVRPFTVGVAVILFGASAVTAGMAWMPGSSGTAGAHAATAAAYTSQASAAGTAKCAECGVVESSQEIVQADDGRGADQSRTGRAHEVTVRMRDGSIRTFMEASSVRWRTGERVILIDGASLTDG